MARIRSCPASCRAAAWRMPEAHIGSESGLEARGVRLSRRESGFLQQVLQPNAEGGLDGKRQRNWRRRPCSQLGVQATGCCLQAPVFGRCS